MIYERGRVAWRRSTPGQLGCIVGEERFIHRRASSFISPGTVAVYAPSHRSNRDLHDVVSPCDPPPRKLPHPQRTAKTFGCDIALMDLPVGLVSDRLLACVRPHVNGKALGLLPASADSRDY